MKKILLTALTAFTLFSCEDYLSVNEDQSNRPDFNLIAPNQMLAGALVGYGNHQNVTLNDFGNRMSYFWGLNTGFTSTDPAYDYNFDSSSYNGLFNNSYLVADNFQDIIDKQSTYPNFEYHVGIAKIFKVMCMDYVTALYGDVPYSQALNDNISYPAYDDDKAIIPALFAELDEARALLNTTNPNVHVLGDEDVVFHGDMNQWNRFLNTVELKLALRLSNTTDAALVTLRNTRFAGLNANPNFINADVAYNPGFNIAVGQRNPVFAQWGLDAALGAWTSPNRAMAAGDFAARLVNGTMNDANITTGIVDPRRGRMFTLSPVVGNVQGNFPTSEISRFGSFYFGRTGSSVDDANNNASIRDAYIMQVAEARFLEAEAIQRGFLTSGTAQAKFYEGINASFAFYSRSWGSLALAALNPATYIANTEANNGLGWTGSTDKISAIMTQKYLALGNWHGIELYLDHLRTGFPVLPLPVSVIGRTHRPYRLVYPSREYSTNSSNVPSVTLDECFSNNPKTPYFLQN
ncbi:SusD/RagB family nutrient-binding outer membrane lipoprotein [Flavobacterium sp. GCM10023249]|uniref:SusD/RagB family nutrient-binding outer membrane lipoprotein n=1 Tax=unclassified Flavobacterium TaxID=196869 RepID=UPI00361B2B8E